MQQPGSQYVVYEHHLLGNLSEPTGSYEERTLHKALKPRQMWMIALGGSMGAGLMVGTGTALSRGGPLGLLLGYMFVGAICWCVMISLGEMCTFLPHKKGFAGYATRFWHPAAGFAMGWSYVFEWLIWIPSQIQAANVILNRWNPDLLIHYWVWPFILGIVFINSLGVRVFGEAEFWLSSFKILTLVGLMLFGLVIDLGGNPTREVIGFRHWVHPGPMGTWWDRIIGNIDLARFVGLGSVLVWAMNAYIGTELIGVTVGEAENPRKTIPIAIKRTFYRIVVFYIGAVFVIGLIVPSDFIDPDLYLSASDQAKQSPWTFAAESVAVRGISPVINGAVIIFLYSAANSDLYTASRSIYALALLNQAPRVFRRVNRIGVPITALAFSSLFALLGLLQLNNITKEVFQFIQNIAATSAILTWMCILYTHICFQRGLNAQGVDRRNLPYRAAFQPYASYIGIAGLFVILVFRGVNDGLASIEGSSKTRLLIADYLPLPLFALLFWIWKWEEGEITVDPREMDLVSGKNETDQEELAYEEAKNEARRGQPRKGILKRLWAHI